MPPALLFTRGATASPPAVVPVSETLGISVGFLHCRCLSVRLSCLVIDILDSSRIRLLSGLVHQTCFRLVGVTCTDDDAQGAATLATIACQRSWQEVASSQKM